MQNLLVKLCFFLLCSCISGISMAQEVLLPRAYEATNVGIVYDREVSFPVTLHTNGFSIGFNTGRLKTYYKTSYWGLSLGHLKHPREFRQSDAGSSFTGGSSSFVFGKQRTLIPIRAVKGWKRYYSGKDKRRGVAVGTAFEIGATAGIAKSYLLQVGTTGDFPGTSSRFISFQDDPDLFLTRGRIEGAGGLRRGWSSLRVYPGINAKASVHLDWGAFDEFMRAVEAGIMVDVFSSNIPILTEPAENQPLFINFYLALHLGKRR